MENKLKYITEEGIKLFENIPFDILLKIDSFLKDLYDLLKKTVPIEDERMKDVIKNIKEFKTQYKDDKNIMDTYLRVMRDSRIGEKYNMYYRCDFDELLRVKDD